MGDIKSILFVCTGNSCRSVMAEGLMKKYLLELGKEHIVVRSAGIIALEGLPPTQETIEVMKKEGVDVSDHRSKPVTERLIKDAGLILVMEERHKDLIVNMVPEANSKTHLLKGFLADGKTDYPEGANIPDPIGKEKEYYKLSLEIIRDQIKRIARMI